MDARPVWLTREQRDGIKQARIMPWLVDAWDAAPADPAEAVREGLLDGMRSDPEARWSRTSIFVNAVLAALGAPKATP